MEFSNEKTKFFGTAKNQFYKGIIEKVEQEPDGSFVKRTYNSKLEKVSETKAGKGDKTNFPMFYVGDTIYFTNQASLEEAKLRGLV